MPPKKQAITPAAKRALEALGDGKLNVWTLAYRANTTRETLRRLISEGVLVVVGREKAGIHSIFRAAKGHSIVCAAAYVHLHKKDAA